MKNMRQTRTFYQSGITRYEEERSGVRIGKLGILVLLALVLLWLALPVARAAYLLWSPPFRPHPVRPAGLPVRSVHFRAADGVSLDGWFVPAAPRTRAPTVVLIPGFKDDRSPMVPYARFLHAAGYNVLLYDSRGTGLSGGTFGLGLREVDDVRGAVAYLQRRSGLFHRYGLLGVSLGAGVAIAAAVHLPSVRAVVADSAYTDQSRVVTRLDSLHLVGPLTVPLAPIAPWVVNRILGADLASFSPLHAVRSVAPRKLLLIHSRHDANPTTPLSGAEKLLRAGGPDALLWIAPRGGHAGALAAQPALYERHVLSFLRRYLGK